MHLCVAGDCATLTWNGTRYDAIRDGQNSVWAFYTIGRWQPDRVEMYGESLRNEPNTAFHVKGNFVGKILSTDGRMVRGEVAWWTGPTSGTLPYEITWDAKTTDIELLSNISKFQPNKVPVNPETIESNSRDGRSWVTTRQSASSAKQTGLPRLMRLCVVNDCATLTWNRDRYDAVRDGQNFVWAFYTIKQWQADDVEFVGSSIKPEPNTMYPVTGVFVGKMSPGGGTFSNGQVKWRTGPASGNLPYQLSWNSNAGVADSRSGDDVSASAQPLPKVMRFCDINCVTLGLQDGKYGDPWGNETWTVETLTNRSAEFTRTSKDPYFSVKYKGSVSDDGNNLVGVANPFSQYDGQPPTIFLTWDLANVQMSTAYDPRYSIQKRQQMDSTVIWAMLLALGIVFSGDSTAAAPPQQTFHPRPAYTGPERRQNPR